MQDRFQPFFLSIKLIKSILHDLDASPLRFTHVFAHAYIYACMWRYIYLHSEVHYFHFVATGAQSTENQYPRRKAFSFVGKLSIFGKVENTHWQKCTRACARFVLVFNDLRLRICFALFPQRSKLAHSQYVFFTITTFQVHHAGCIFLVMEKKNSTNAIWDCDSDFGSASEVTRRDFRF